MMMMMMWSFSHLQERGARCAEKERGRGRGREEKKRVIGWWEEEEEERERGGRERRVERRVEESRGEPSYCTDHTHHCAKSTLLSPSSLRSTSLLIHTLLPPSSPYPERTSPALHNPYHPFVARCIHALPDTTARDSNAGSCSVEQIGFL